tara:strand:+ start:118 stop:468 length:351 start_codon:yes stop_codon:yes gene_type:complete
MKLDQEILNIIENLIDNGYEIDQILYFLKIEKGLESISIQQKNEIKKQLYNSRNVKSELESNSEKSEDKGKIKDKLDAFWKKIEKSQKGKNKAKSQKSKTQRESLSTKSSIRTYRG